MRSSLVSQALQIVMEHSMLPDLGWNIEPCDTQIRRLRENTLAHQLEIEFCCNPEKKLTSPYSCFKADDIEENAAAYLGAMVVELQHRNEVRKVSITSLLLRAIHFFLLFIFLNCCCLSKITGLGPK
jgi:hypothetical protein